VAGTLKNVTDDSFEQDVLKSDKPVLVDFWAAWCGPCRQFAPVYEAASAKHDDIVFGKVDTEAEQSLASAANITSIPTLMAFKEGVLVFAQPGALPQSALQDVIEQVKNLDMAPIKEQMAAEAAAGAAPTDSSGQA
jgi:thioredoxin 1